MARRARALVIAIGLCLCACEERATLDVRVHHSPAFVLADAISELTVEVRDVDTGRVVARRTFAGSVLSAPVTLVDDAMLEIGRRYEIRALGTATPACRLGRAVGRTPPFVHAQTNDAVAMVIGCADELATAPDQPTFARLSHALVTNARGEAVLVGGAGRAEPVEEGIGWRDLPSVTETWDPLLARFVVGATLLEPRVLPGVLALPDGSVALVGGFVDLAFGCTTSVERVLGVSSALGGPLSHLRCAPATAYLPGPDAVLVTGGAFAAPLDRTTDAELWDATLRARIAGDLAAASFRSFARAVPLPDGESALVAIGNIGGAPPVEVARVSGTCGSEVCFEPVEGGPDPSRAWSDASMTWVSCARGGGAVYLVGGQLQTGQDPQEAIADAWCYLDVPGDAAALYAAGRLPSPRSGHAAVALEGAPGAQRLLLVGGTPTGDALPYSDALLVPVDGCTCSALDPASTSVLPVPFVGYPMLSAATTLRDGTVLVVGGARFSSSAGGLVIEATGEAALFVPDVAP